MNAEYTNRANLHYWQQDFICRNCGIEDPLKRAVDEHFYDKHFMKWLSPFHQQLVVRMMTQCPAREEDVQAWKNLFKSAQERDLRHEIDFLE